MRILAFFVFVVSFFVFFSPAYANTSCQSIYGGQTCTNTTITLEKDVLNPQTKTYVHDLGTTDFNFQPGQTITFHIKITNNGTNLINTIAVTDNFPEFVNFASGPGNFDNNARTLTWTINNLAPNQTQIFSVEGTIFTPPNLPPLSQNCDVNQATALTDDNQMAQDSSQFCISQSTTATTTPSPTNVSQLPANVTPFPTVAPPLTSTPVTGANPLALVGLVGLGAGGFGVLKLSNRKDDE